MDNAIRRAPLIAGQVWRAIQIGWMGDPVAYSAIAVWFAVMVCVPILRWTVGEALFPLDISAGVVAQVAASLIALRRVWPMRTIALTAIALVIGAWGVEFIGHTTDFPFGAYHYTDRLQPQLGGVPLFVPLAWLMMLPAAWTVAHLLTGDRPGWRGRVAFIGWSALAFTAWDLFLDPQMVAWDLWRWDDPSGFTYFGIPWINYAGWLLASLALTTLASLIAPVRRLPIGPLLTIYAITWFLETFGLILFWGQPGPGVVGGVVMGAFLFTAIARARRLKGTP